MSEYGATCDIKGCQDSKAWGLTKNGRLYRLTFSKAVAEHINNSLNNQYTLQRFKLTKGRRLSPGETCNGLYGIIDRRKDFILRIALDQRIAETLCDWDWRYLQELFITPCK